MLPFALDRRRHPLIAGLAALTALLAAPDAAHAQANAVAAWRVECSGDGKTLECRAVQQMVQQQSGQVVVQLAVRTPADTKTPVMMIQLPLGLNLAEPLQLKVDNGPIDRQQLQTCTQVGCFAGMPLNDKLLASMRSGSMLRIAFQDAAKRAIAIDVPLLGFGLALDRAK